MEAHLSGNTAEGHEVSLEWWGNKECKLPPGTVQPFQERMFSWTYPQENTGIKRGGCSNGTVFVSGQLCTLWKQAMEEGSGKHHSLQELKAQQLPWGLQASFRYAKT